MNHPEQTPKKPTATTGLFALLCGLLGVGGTRASKIIQGTDTSKASRRLILAALATTLGALAFTAAPALATPGHEFSGEFNGGVGHEFSDPTGVAVNSVTGDVYVVDKGNNRVEEFNREGTFIEEFSGKGTAGELSEPEAIAIDNSGESASEDPSVGDVYVTDHHVVDKFQADGTYLGQITIGKGGAPLEEIDGVAVDPKGQVWVDQDNAQIDAFSDSASDTFLSSRQLEFVVQTNPGFAVDSEDNLYADHSINSHVMGKFNSMGKSLQAVQELGRTGVAVEPVSNNVYIDSANPEEGAPAVQVYTPSETTPGGFIVNSPPAETFGEAQLADHGGTALAVSYANVSSGDVYVVDSSANKVDMFVPPKVKGYVENFSFGSKGAGSGEFTELLGIAVNDSTNPVADPQAEDVYVVDKGNKRVEQFNSTGTKVEAEFAPPGGFNEPKAIAVDNSCQLQNPALTGLECEAFDPSDGDVYVTDQLPNTESGAAFQSLAAEVDKFSSTGTYLGQLRRCPEEERSLTLGEITCVPEGHPTAGFDQELSGVAVGPEGNVWVGAGNSVEAFDEFSDTGIFLETFADVLGTAWTGGPFGAAGPAIVTGASALDPLTGQLFVDKQSVIDRYSSGVESPAGLVEGFPAAGALQESQGIAVSPAGTVYATERTADDVKAFKEFPLAQVAVGALANLSPTSVTLQGSVNPEGAKVSSCEFEYGTTTSYGQTAACEPAAGSLGEGAEPKLVSAKLSGLPPGSTYHYRLVVSDVRGTNASSDHLFATPGPGITAEQVTYIEAEAATLNAQIDPDGNATSYHFEYDTSPYTSSAAHGTSLPVPSAAIGAGTSPVPVILKLQGLHAGTTYYYRAVAEGEPLGAPESFYGTGKTFTTNPTPGTEPPQNCPNEHRRAEQPFGLTLPDCRAYEMVSPVETEGTDATDPPVGGESVGLIKGGQVRASEDKAKEAGAEEAAPAITYSSLGSFAEPGGATIESQLLSRRNVQEGRWESRSITAPYEHDHNAEGGAGYYGVFFTPELTEGLTSTAADLTSAPEAAPEALGELYRANFPEDLDLHQPISYRLVSQLPPSEEIYATPYASAAGVYPLGASSDLSHVVFATETDESAPIGPLREWVNGRVVSVGVSNTPSELPWTPAAVGNSGPGLVPDGNADVWRAVSEDGSRVVFNRSGGASGALYVRQNGEREQSPMRNVNTPDEECEDPADACTIKLSAGAARYWGASTDDSKIFYTEGEDLYEYALPIGSVSGHATDLTPGGEVQAVAQISEDGSYVYFVANGVLGDAGAHGATPGNCGVIVQDSIPEATGTACNLYVSHAGGEPAFIATLSAKDGEDWLKGPGGDSAALALGAAGGARLAFTSLQSLTGYDNEEAGPGECGEGENGKKCREVYLYDAETDTLVCASCNPSGARPVGPAGLAVGSYYAGAGASNYRPRDLLADGELFFDSKDALVPHASDGRQNVYEFQDGHVYPISNVSGGKESFFLDASPDGQDVFFASADQLLPEDTGDNVAVWDARADGGFPVKVSPPACTTAEACRAASPPTPGIYGPPPSATFSGPGNIAPPPPTVVKKKTAAEVKAEKLAKALKACRTKKNKQKRQACEKQARSKYGVAKKKAKKATTNRRASR